MASSISTLVNDLPQTSITTRMLNALDFVVPGEWQNLTDFNQAIETVTGETGSKTKAEIRSKALELYKDADNGYQRAIWLYSTVDRADAALGAAALANKVGERISFLSFLSSLTPKADNAQSIDLGVKLVTELMVYCLINGLPRDRDGIIEFTKGLGTYGQENLMRMVALISIDGLIPLGPNFADSALNTINSLGASTLTNNQVFDQVSGDIPGEGAQGKLSFITDSFASTQSWLTDFTTSHNLTPEVVTDNLKGYIDFSDDKLDYLAAFLDMSTNYYYHTGTQSVARHLINRAYKEG